MATATILDVDKLTREGQEIATRAGQQYVAVVGEQLREHITRVTQHLGGLQDERTAVQAELTALEKRVQEAKARATAAEDGARAKQDDEAVIDQRIETKRAEEKRLDGVLMNLRQSITTAAASA
jgi:septal ring factor EnvC (AmiA/AmiB activator)